MELQASPFQPPVYSPPAFSGLHLACANICAKRMARTPDGNIGKYTGNECVTA
jgi:hypothetical protein